LEGGGTVGHSEEHHKRLEETAVGVEGCLPFISRLDTHIIETPSDIKFCEVSGSVELGDEFGDERKRVPVLDGYGIQSWTSQSEPSFFLMKNTGAAMGDLEGRICLVRRFSLGRHPTQSVLMGTGDRLLTT